jgi:hypothetical protein
VPTEFHLAQCDLAQCRFLRLFELEIGFEPSAAIPASLRPHLVQEHTICRARIYLGRHSSRYKRSFAQWLKRLTATEWVVYAKPPFGGPRQVLKYLARYTHRVAISNQRLVSLENGVSNHVKLPP